MNYSRICGLGSCVPDRIVTNEDLCQWMDTSHEWIVERTGIHERRWVEDGDTGMRLATEASREAMRNAGVTTQDIDLIVFATMSPDHEFPGTGMFMQRELGLAPAPVVDIRQQCSGFVYALAIADNFIRSGNYRCALVVGAEVQTRGMDVSTRGRHIAALFGDGAGAAVIGLSEDPDHRILSTHLHADGADAEILYLDKPGWQTRPRVSPEDVKEELLFPTMEGPRVYKHALIHLPEAVREALAANKLCLDDLDMLIPHQANLRINEAVVRALGLPPEKCHNNIQKYGNTTSATIPICMKEAVELGKIQSGDLVCLVAFGAGLTWGSVLLRY